MEMINVLKRLAELDSGNPNVKNRMTVDTPIATVSNVYEDTNSVEECGDMPAPSAAPHSAANISVTANSGDEVASMLKSLMALSGLSNTSSMPSHKEIEVSSPHAAHTDHDDMAKMISMIDNSEDHHKMTDDEQDEGFIGTGLGGYAGGELGGMAGGALGTAIGGPVGGAIGAVVGDVAGTALGAKAGNSLTGDDEKDEGMYDNSPEQEIEPHDYGDKQVKPKQQGFAQRLGDNPYKMAHESINNLSSQLLKEYEAFKNAQ
jgi:hypothetical protein